MNNLSVAALTIVLSLLSIPVTLYAQISGDSILVNRSVNNDLYLAGRNIDVLTSVDGDLVGAGRRLSIGGQINQDLTVAGETIIIEATILDDLRVVGRSVILSGVVDGHMVAAAQTISISQDAVIGNWAWLAADTIDITGTINGELRSVSRTITVDGEILGDVDVMGESLRIGPRAVINGNLTWRSPNSIDISDSALVRGSINESDLPEEWRDHDDADVGSILFTIISLTVGSVVFFLLMPGFNKTNAALLGNKPWHCIGSGLGVLILVPFLILLLLITVIGFLPALALLMAYLTCLIIGMLSGIIAIGNVGLSMTGKHEGATKFTWVLAIVFAAIATGLAWSIPVIGGLLFFLIWIVGLGCTSLGLVNQFRRA
jgi:cytoskeletal protein CcmA (bactofilin family)